MTETTLRATGWNLRDGDALVATIAPHDYHGQQKHTDAEAEEIGEMIAHRYNVHPALVAALRAYPTTCQWPHPETGEPNCKPMVAGADACRSCRTRTALRDAGLA